MQRFSHQIGAVVSFARKYWLEIYAVSSIAFLAFVFGVITMRTQVFPYPLIKLVEAQIDATWKYIDLFLPKPIEEHPNIILWAEDNTKRGKRTGSIAGDELTFFAGFRGEAFGFGLVDSRSQINYEWSIPARIFDKIREVSSWPLEDGHYVVQGVHLYENGDILFNITERALIKIDRCSQEIWSIDNGTHHSIFVDEQGFIWAPGGRRISDPEAALEQISTPYRDDLVLKISPEGKILESFSVLESAYASEYQGLVLQGQQGYPNISIYDPLHLNDVEIVSTQFAERNAFVEQGDIMVSLKTLDTIAFIDRKTHRIKYVLKGMMLRQHDPDQLNNGNVLIFDNRTAIGRHNDARITLEEQAFGYSRIIEVNPNTQQIEWVFEGSTDDPFYTAYLGQVTKLGNGNVLVVETEGGRIFEVDQESRDIVWEFQNVIGETDGTSLLGRVTHADRYHRDDLPFLSETCGAAETE